MSMGMMIGSRMMGGGGMEPALFVGEVNGEGAAPLCAGNYIFGGIQRSRPCYHREDGAYYVWINASPDWYVSTGINQYTPRWSNETAATFTEGVWPRLDNPALDDAYVSFSLSQDPAL